MHEQNLFNFAWIHVKAAGNNHIFGAVQDVKVAILIHFPDIACTHPAIDKDAGSLLLALPVTLHNVWPFDRDLTFLAHRYGYSRFLIKDSCIHIRQRKTNASIPDITVEGIAVRYRARLAQAIALNQFAMSYSLEIYAHLSG